MEALFEQREKGSLDDYSQQRHYYDDDQCVQQQRVTAVSQRETTKEWRTNDGWPHLYTATTHVHFAAPTRRVQSEMEKKARCQSANQY